MLACFTADVVVLQAAASCHASLQVWNTHKAIQVFAPWTFQPINWLTCTLVERSCNSLWRLYRCSAAVGTQLLPLKVRRRCFQVVLHLSVRIFDCPASTTTQCSWHSTESSQIELCVVRLWSNMYAPRVKKCVRELNFAVVDKVPGRV